jgi:AraC-like DNA-binding protein
MDYIGRTCKDIYPKEFAEQYMALVRQVRETGVAVENQVYTHAADHSTDFRIASVYPLRDAHDAIIGTATVWRPVASGDTLPDWYGCLKRVVTFIDKNYARPITLQTLAAEAGMSITHFRRRFAGILHITPARYLATIRVNAAIKLLTSTHMLLTEIAHACGFYDQSHFIRTFKRLRRQTPAQYRRAHFTA